MWLINLFDPCIDYFDIFIIAIASAIAIASTIVIVAFMN